MAQYPDHRPDHGAGTYPRASLSVPGAPCSRLPLALALAIALCIVLVLVLVLRSLATNP